ncbi:MAG: hypothetical protein LBP69_06630 [Treponema sp.]|jgi:hypothetical protein|nr:hypothetical protein [Treponema sp.]
MSDMGQQREPARGLTFEDVWAMFQETGRKMQETDRELEKTGRFIRELNEKADREREETYRQIKEMNARTDKQLGKLGNRFGELVEHLITPNIVEKFRELNYAFTKAGLDVEFFDHNGKALAEVDAWLENGEFALAVEIKSNLREQDVDRHIRRLEILRGYLDERDDRRKLLGAAAAAVVNAGVKEYALEKGFYVIEQSGDTLKIDVPEDFTPKVW